MFDVDAFQVFGGFEIAEIGWCFFGFFVVGFEFEIGECFELGDGFEIFAVGSDKDEGDVVEVGEVVEAINICFCEFACGELEFFEWLDSCDGADVGWG